ncbi:MAG: hypothetical protein HY698_10230, partial [Deltaproteobacteria bacterium]|nr:hypothetical protein [Deltaproteobacteria bacterium]
MQSPEARSSLTWEARPLGELLRLSWPITLSTMSYSVMTLVSTLLVSRIGAAELAGVGLGGVTAFAFLCFAIGLLQATKILVAQAHGSGRREEIGRYLGASLLIATGLGLSILIAGQLAAPLLARITATD